MTGRPGSSRSDVRVRFECGWALGAEPVVRPRSPGPSGTVPVSRPAAGLAALLTSPGPVIVVVVDVLSFSTAVVVAAEAGVLVAPAPVDPPPVVPDGAVLAGTRGSGRPSLSPASIRGLPPGTRLVLPSPNGGALSFAAAAAAAETVLAAGIRNAAATAQVVRRRLERDATCTAVVLAAGEWWPDGRPRPAIEDIVGSARLLAGLPGAWLSSDARAVATAAALDRRVVAAGASARELLDRGFGDDVATALDGDASDVVPALSDGWFGAR